MNGSTLASAADGGIPIVQFFRLLGPNNEIALCRSYRVGAGIELRFGVDGEAAVMAEGVASHNRALTLAGEWRLLLTATGSFIEDS